MEVASEASGASILERIRRRPYPLLLVAPAFLVLFLLTIYPFLYMVWISLHKWPILPTLPRIFVGADTYAYIFRDGEFWNSVGVTSLYMAVSVGLQLALGLFLAMLLDARYRAFQWFRLPFMIPVFVSPVVVGLIWDLLFWFLSIRMIPPIVGAIPLFVLAAQFRLIDTYVILPVLYIILNMPFAVWMLKSFIDEIPRENDESAMLEGCGNLAVIRRMILPLAKPGLIATAVFCFILAWNEFLLANIFTRRVAVTLPVGISKLITEKQILWGYITAAATLATLPPVVLLWLFQRNLLRGLTFGAVR